MQRFQKSARLLKPDDFQRVKGEGFKYSSGPITVAAILGDEKRLGLVVSKRVGCAVERNRIKRVVREYFRSNSNEFPVGDCVVVAQPGLADLDNATICNTLSRALAGLLKRAKRGTLGSA